MGFEITYKYHPRKEGGGYDTDNTQEKSAKVGKPFDETPLEKCAAVIMSQLARRDIWVVDVEVCELVRKKISFKESVDGKGIVLKNKRFSFNAAAEMVAEDVVETPSVQQLIVPEGMQPHEVIAMQPAAPQPVIDSLYADPNKSLIPINRPLQVDQKKVLYEVYFEPYLWSAEAQKSKLHFTENKKYPVHAVIPHPNGRLDLQKIVVTDDTGRAVKVDEKFFEAAGRGLYADKQLGFSGDKKRGERKTKLMYDGELTISEPVQQSGSVRLPEDLPAELRNLPLDDGTIPEHMLNVPDIRPKKLKQA